MGDTGWLLPEKLNRDEAAYYLEHCRQAGFNVVQVQTINGVPAMNFYGQYSMIDGFNFKNYRKLRIKRWLALSHFRDIGILR